MHTICDIPPSMMATKALFEGLVVDEFESSVEVVQLGSEAFYVIDDEGFKRHVESEQIDRQVLQSFADLIEGHEDLITDGTMKMLGQDDIFTKAVIESSLSNMADQFEKLIEQGLPEDARTYLGMMGFKVIVDIHGQVLEVVQPGMSEEG